MPTAIMLHAHPDDEVFATFGWASDLVSQGYDLLGVSATGGEAGELHAAASLEEARARRIAKYEAALDLLGARAWRWLEESAPWVDAPSGPTLSDADPEHLRVAVERLLAEHRPDLILTVGSDGLTGHPDHIAMSRAVSAATDRGDVADGVWGARLRADDVRAGAALIGSHMRGITIGSGRVVGTDVPLVVRDVRSSAGSRRRALDLYRDGLGTDSLESVVRDEGGVGDSVLLRAIFDATDWAREHYEAMSGNHSSTAAGQGASG